jgi:hypothetical protein
VTYGITEVKLFRFIFFITVILPTINMGLDGQYGLVAEAAGYAFAGKQRGVAQ